MSDSNGSNTGGSTDQGATSRLGSFAGTHPDFKDDVPESFKQARQLTHDFDDVRDPLIKKQIEDLHKTESQRREGGNGGSHMVKRQKPHPELKPNHTGAHPATRQSFNQAWLQEQRLARFSEFEIERLRRKQRSQNQDNTQQYVPQR